jgi:hypothetical protein
MGGFAGACVVETAVGATVVGMVAVSVGVIDGVTEGMTGTVFDAVGVIDGVDVEDGVGVMVGVSVGTSWLVGMIINVARNWASSGGTFGSPLSKSTPCAVEMNVTV